METAGIAGLIVGALVVGLLVSRKQHAETRRRFRRVEEVAAEGLDAANRARDAAQMSSGRLHELVQQARRLSPKTRD